MNGASVNGIGVNAADMGLAGAGPVGGSAASTDVAGMNDGVGIDVANTGAASMNAASVNWASAAPTAVLFDLFGVIARAQSPAGQSAILAAANVPAEGADRFWRAYWDIRPSYDRGRLSGPEYWELVAAATKTTFTRAQIGELIAADCGSWRAVDQRMVDLLGTLARSGVTLGLLSNIPPELADEFLKRYSWLDRFAVLGFSCRIGHVKPEPAAFEWCIKALDVEPAGILMVDDREENIRGAEACGLQGHLFTDPATLIQQLSCGGRGCSGRTGRR
jgi:putative hydrolase of the HAD superfamily